MKTPILGFVGDDDRDYYIVTQPQLEQMIIDFFKIPNSVQTTYIKDDSWYFDYQYRALPVQRFGQFLNSWHNILNILSYTREYFDCEDFSLLFMSLLRACGYTSGMVVGELYYNEEFIGYHAWNLLLFCNPNFPDVTQSFRIYEFEPQIGEILMNHKSTDGFRYVGRWVIW